MFAVAAASIFLLLSQASLTTGAPSSANTPMDGASRHSTTARSLRQASKNERERTGASLASIPPPGTVEWAQAVAAAQEEAWSVQGPEDLERCYKRLLTLYRECRACRRKIVEILERRLEYRPGDATAIRRVLEAEFADDPLSLGRLLNDGGRFEEAKSTVEASLEHTRFVERQLDLLEVLASAHAQLGELSDAGRMARRLLDDTPVSSQYCEKALRWWAWLGEEPVHAEMSFSPHDFISKFEHVRELERTRGNVPYVSCLYNHYLLLLDRYILGMSSAGESVPDDVLSLFPDGIDVPQQQLARRTSDPKVRAALLLNVAWRYWTKDQHQYELIVREAREAASWRSIEVGTLVTPLMSIPEARTELEHRALRLIDDFPEYEASCEGCFMYWEALTLPWSQFPNRVKEWEGKCRKLMNECPVEHWRHVVGFLGTANENSKEVYEALLENGVPDDVLPFLLLRLRTAIGKTDPKRSWSLARRALRHPEFPAMMLGYGSADLNQFDAEEAGDFRSALFVELLARRPDTGLFNPDGWSETKASDFRVAYYQLRVGMKPHERWSVLIKSLPAFPGDPSSVYFHTPFFLDRLITAARIVHEERAGLEWLVSVRKRYLDGLKNLTPDGQDSTRRKQLQAVDSMLEKYVEQLQGSARFH